ncbi:MAG: hypothetical protein KGY66_07920, partial [Candidatus Thermoplasmatota archaeon]|nr:hypothetical protein [Candidatus Thermoplasmatota archaeon]
MKAKKYVVGLIALVLLLAIPGLASAQYSDNVSDSGDDIFYYYVTETSVGWRTNKERPNIDIIEASIGESDGNISVSLKVKGTIQNDTAIHYQIVLKDESDNSYHISYGYQSHGECYLQYSTEDSAGGKTLEYSGIGESTFETSFSLDDVGNPNSLEIAEVITHDWVDSDEEGTEYYTDTAGPEADEPVDEDVDSDQILGDLFARGMMCIAVAIILPIIIIVIIIVVVLKVLSGGDEGSQDFSS